jgi:mannose-6-phosphate isomerase-like protein (cupin superfamily)
MQALLLAFLAIATGAPQERKIDATWLYRDLPALREQRLDLSTDSCHYVPIFGEGDSEARSPKSISRFGELTVDPHGVCGTVEYPRQEELYFVLEGTGVLHCGDESHPLSPDDFTYVAPGASHSVSNPSDRPLRLVVSTVRIPPDIPISPVGKLVVANLGELQARTVGGHPDSVLYKLLIGPRSGARDRINATYAVADFFLMDFAPGGTNFPHHHETEEEVYLVLDGEGRMAAGSGTDGVAGLRPAKSGDAYYFRPNCTVGFYNQDKPGAKAHILALRTFVPIPKTSE